MCSTTCTTTPLRANQTTATILLQRISRVNPREIFFNQPDGLFRMLTPLPTHRLPKTVFIRLCVRGTSIASDFESLDAAFKRLAVSGLENSLTSKCDADVNPPICIGMDYNANINWIVTGQPDGRAQCD